MHVAVLPALTTALLTAHLLLVQRHGMSVPPGVEAGHRRTGEPLRWLPFVPNFLLRDAIGWCAALGALAGLAALFPWELGEKADLFAPAPAGIRPEWYFGWAFQTLKMLPARVLGVEGELLAILVIGLLGLLWLLVPILDRSPEYRDRRTAVFTVLGWVVIGYLAVSTLLVYLPTRS